VSVDEENLEPFLCRGPGRCAVTGSRRGLQQAAGVLGILLALAGVSHAQYSGPYQTNIISGVVSNWPGAYIVGSNWVSDVLRIESAGQLNSTTGYLGYASGANNNAAIVTGTGAVWSNSNDLIVGYSGAGNTLTITNAGKVFNTAAYVGRNTSASNNAVTVTGVGSVWTNTGSLYVGYNGGGNTLVIANAGKVFNTAAYVGYNTSASNNAVTVTGVGSVWTNTGSLLFGDSSGGKTLVIANAGKVFNYSAYVGGSSSASNNTVTVTGSGSVWRNLNNLYIGNVGGGNTLTVSNGGSVYNQDGFVGFNGRNNAVTVTGPGSVWTNTSYLYIGVNTASNMLTITSGGTVFDYLCYLGYNASASNNVVTVSGSGSVWNNTGSLNVGYSSSGNTLTITNAATVFSTASYIGYNTSASNNAVTVIGPGSVWTNAGPLFIGNQGGSNQLIITAGATVYDTEGNLGSNTVANANQVLVSGAGSRWINTLDLNVGRYGSSNRLIVADGGYVSNRWACVGNFSNAMYNGATVTGSGSVWQNEALRVGGYDRSNTLIIASGGVVRSGSGYIGSESGGDYNTAIVTDSGSLWSNGTFYVGYYGIGNSLTIANGGSVLNNSGYIGQTSRASNNSVTVTGTGAVWHNRDTLYVGLFGAGNTLTITNRGTVIANNAIVGASANANRINVTDGNLIVTNAAGTGALDIRRGTLTFNGGSIVADRLYATNGTSSAIAFNSGTLATRGTHIANTQPFTVGNGVDAAVYRMIGGTHEFGDDLIVATAAKIMGSGTVVGDVTQSGTIAPGESPGVIRIEGNWTQLASAILDLEIGGLLQGSEYDFMDVTGHAALNGTLQLHFINGFVPSATDTFTVIHAEGGISGMFTNVVARRIYTVDRMGSFAWSVVGDELLLSQYQSASVPEPTVVGLWLAGALVLARYGWWRKQRAANG